MATEYGGTYGGRPWRHAAPSYGRPPPYRARRGTPRWFAAVAALVLGIAGLIVSLVGLAFQALPRQFTAHQQRQIVDWETAKRWRELPAGTIFPASLNYAAPSVISGDPALRLGADRLGIARQASCAAATDAAVGAVLTRDGCEAMLRATYVDGTDSYVVTVGVVAMSGSAQVSAARQQLAGVVGASGKGVAAVPVAGTLAAAFTDSRRQLSGSVDAGTYLILYTIGYTDGRPRVPVTADNYADAEMSAVGQGVAQEVASVLDPREPPPRCPGTPGC